MTQNTTSKSKIFSIRIDNDILNHVQEMAKREDLSVSYIIRKALRKGLNLPQLAKDTPVQLPENWE